MKVVAFNGSPAKTGNTYHALKTVCQVLEQNGIETEIVQGGRQAAVGLPGLQWLPGEPRAPLYPGDDGMNGFDKMVEADGILIGSPVYYGNVSTETKALIDRCGMLAGANGAAPQAEGGRPSHRRAAGGFQLHLCGHQLLLRHLSDDHPNFTVLEYDPGSETKGDYEKDAEGIETFRVLGKIWPGC